MSQGNLCYILADAEKDWIYVESGDVRGFVSKEAVQTGDEVKSAGRSSRRRCLPDQLQN